MSDREAFVYVADAIAELQLAAQQLPLPELWDVTVNSQTDLARSLNDFNDIILAHDDDEPSTEVMHAIGEVTRRATALAIFTLGLAHRAHLAAHQN
jgi:hypothetical protein